LKVPTTPCAIAGAKIGLVLLNGQNADLHTTRSAEIPAVGTAMCAPRTPHHQQLYKEGEEAIFFDGADDCAEACKRLLADDGRRPAIADAGHRRIVCERDLQRGPGPADRRPSR
jgi:spore maturation protein CgeB